MRFFSFCFIYYSVHAKIYSSADQHDVLKFKRRRWKWKIKINKLSFFSFPLSLSPTLFLFIFLYTIHFSFFLNDPNDWRSEVHKREGGKEGKKKWPTLFYREAWNTLFNGATLSTLKEGAISGTVCQNGLRSVCWKV